MVRGGDGKWRTMVDDGLYSGKMAIGAIYRAELAQGLKDLGYQIEKTHTDGRFELAGVPRNVIEAFSTRRAEIEAAMKAHDLGTPIDDPRLADRTALMTRAHKRDIDKDAPHQDWSRQAAELGFSADTLVEIASVREGQVRDSATQDHGDIVAHRDYAARCEYVTVGTAAWAAWHLGEREAVFSHASLLTKSLDSFDFKAIPALNKARVLELARCEWIERRENVIALGPSGTGKSHVALGLGLAACQKGLSVRFITAAALVHELMEARDERRLLRLQKQLASLKLLIIDEVGFVPLSKTGAELLFEPVSQRYERGATLITSNLPFDEWTETFGSERLTGALLDRLTHHVNILELNGDSYRLSQSRARRNSAAS